MATTVSPTPGELLARVREQRPLVHNITNLVVTNVTANALLAIGAAPVMAHAPEEVEIMAAAADALVLNIGTLTTPWVEAMLQAGRAANGAGTPVIVDPVGAGFTPFRTDTSARLLRELTVAAVRGNAGELRALAGAAGDVRGVDAAGSAASAAEARQIARGLGTTVALTGPVDQLSDGSSVVSIANGDALLARVTGTGCIATALGGAFLGVAADTPLAALTAALVSLEVAAEEAAREARGPGTFAAALLDALSKLDHASLDDRARVEMG
ncbi:MAG: hydroxyethylthiazole kinase [Candidatus Dormibacteria bacterium]